MGVRVRGWESASASVRGGGGGGEGEGSWQDERVQERGCVCVSESGV